MTDPRIDTDLVRGLIADQFPHWAGLEIKPVETSGWDNRTFHLGEKMSVRLPSAARYAAQVEKEQRWLPHLAPYLPLPIPHPIETGQPSAAYPFQWSIMKWLPGETAAAASNAVRQSIALDLAHVLNRLRAAPTSNGPVAGQHNFYRGGDLRIYDQEVRHCLGQLGTHVDAEAILRLWDQACHSSWSRSPVWIHGDVAAGNLLVRDGMLSAVIDFGNCGIGDPACDLTIAWTLFAPPARSVFCAAIDLDADCWKRAAGWALWKALLQMCQGDTQADDVINSILEDAVVKRVL